MSANNKETMDTDIVIIGGGGAGLAAAVTAAENHARVIVLEKRKTTGGNSVMAFGLFGAESPTQKRMMIDADRDKLFRQAMEYSHWRINAKLFRTFIDKSGETIQWLEDKGVRFADIYPVHPNQSPRTWHCPKEGGTAIIQALVESCEEMQIPILKQTSVEKILTDEHGKAIGVIATSKDKELKISAKSIIVATGGYAGNKGLLKKYYPHYNENMYLRGLPHNGDGFRMATAIGANTEGLGVVQSAGPRFPGSYDLFCVATEPNMVWVNKRGERFADESIAYNVYEGANTILNQPGQISFTLFDEKIKRGMVEDGLIKGKWPAILPLTRMNDLDAELHEEAKKGTLIISDSWSKVAEWIGADSEMLHSTVKEYNKFCDQGHDGIFVKERRLLTPLREPPYYAMKCQTVMLTTIGGIKINHHMEVLDQKDEVIPGLYAVGNDAGGWETETYNLNLSGSSFGFAINSGRIAAENASGSLNS